jgi:hypothetical protein
VDDAEFAQMAAERSGGNTQIFPLLHRTDKPAAIDLDGTETRHEIAATLAQAWDDGYDAVTVKNYNTARGKTNLLVVRDPAQLRSPAATFDPAQRDSSDLLAGIGGVAAGVGAGAYAATADSPAHSQQGWVY